MKKVTLLLSALVFSVLVSCSETEAKQPDSQKQEQEQEQEQEQAQSKSQTILFFMNPHGRPCQIQDSIITSMGSDVTENASVQYIKTTERSIAMPLFQKYGVRALPSLIILDENGNEKKRFSPGIQGSEQITKALQ